MGLQNFAQFQATVFLKMSYLVYKRGYARERIGTKTITDTGSAWMCVIGVQITSLSLAQVLER